MVRRKVLVVKALAYCFSILVLCGFVVSENSQPNTSGTGWVLRFDGIGAVRVGMTINEVSTALGEHFSTPTAKDEQACFYVEPKQHPDTAITMLDGHVARIDVTAPKDIAPNTTTAAGIRIGDSESRVKEVYGPKLTLSAHQYDPNGHYLTIRSGKYGLRFETDGKRVTDFYAGTPQAISFVEGCL